MSAATIGGGTSPGANDSALREDTAAAQAYTGRGNVSFAQKRQYERYVVALDVAFTVESERVQARSKDVSLGGMFVVTDRALPYGTTFELEVKLPALPQPAVIEATVRWSGPNGMGVQWGLLRARETWAIHQLTKR